MFEQDYVIRLVKEIARAILKLAFDIDAESPTEVLVREFEENETMLELLTLIDRGRIDEAENRLFEAAEDDTTDDAEGLKRALLFYSHLNDKTDGFLEKNGFSRDEVLQGMRDIAALYGFGGIADLYAG